MLSSGYPVLLICDVLDCSRSSYYYQPEPPDETELKTAIETVAAEWPTYASADGIWGGVWISR